MNARTVISTFALIGCLCSCDQKQPPPPKVTPLPTPAPTPIPTPTPISKRLAPEGVFYLTEYISISSEDGVRGFAPGLRVTLVDTVGDVVQVSNGKVTIEVRSHQLTNDLDIADSVRKQDSIAQRLAAQARTQAGQYVNILQATYGYGTKSVDVTDRIRGDILAGRTTIRSGNDLVGQDPASGIVKMLRLTYSIGGGSPIAINLREGESISLPALPTAQPVIENSVQNLPQTRSTATPVDTNPLHQLPRKSGKVNIRRKYYYDN